jgi:hypothetical protein
MQWPPRSSTHSPTTPPVIDDVGGVGMRVAVATDKMGPLTSRREFLVAMGTTVTCAAALACGLWRLAASDARWPPGAPTAVVADRIGHIAVHPYPTHGVALALELDHRAIGVLGSADRQIL